MAGLMDDLNKAVSKLQDLGGKAVEGAKEALDKTDIDEKLIDAAKGLKGKAQEVLDKTDIDEKLIDAAKGLKDKAQEALDKTRDGAAKAPGTAKDAMSQIRDEVSAQVEQIRSAATASNPIHDFIQKQYHPESAAPEEAAAPADAGESEPKA